MLCLVLLLSVLIQNNAELTASSSDRAKITILNAPSKPIPYQMPRFDAGPSVGNMLGYHFFPGIDYYNAGQYFFAQGQLDYVIARPAYLEGNPRRGEFMSTAHYLMGMIYVYHAEGLGRRNLAIEHFEKAIEWNSNNYMAYIELARVFGELRINKQANAILQHLLDMQPPEVVAEQARNELTKFSSNDK